MLLTRHRVRESQARAAQPEKAEPALREAVFQARGLTKTYRMGDVDVPALRSVDLDLYRGELVVILGASGSGKSTLLNILGGLDTPTSGVVRFRDHDLFKKIYGDSAAITRSTSSSSL